MKTWQENFSDVDVGEIHEYPLQSAILRQFEGEAV